jgi:hypothetical protein
MTVAKCALDIRTKRIRDTPSPGYGVWVLVDRTSTFEARLERTLGVGAPSS